MVIHYEFEYLVVIEYEFPTMSKFEEDENGLMVVIKHFNLLCYNVIFTFIMIF